MSTMPDGTRQTLPPNESGSSFLSPTPGQLLLEQYKLLEERRKYFGTQFMQTIGGLVAIVSLAITLLSGKTESRPLLKYALTFGGCAFLLLALLAQRLSKRQDDCEQGMCEAESLLESIGYEKVVKMRLGSKHGARLAIVASVAILGAVLLTIGIFQFRSTGW
jgi:hypothetical protein